MSEDTVRAATEADAEAVADLLLRSRRATTEIPSTIHDDDQVREWVRDILIPSGVVWVIGGDDLVAAMALDGDWVDQLYVAPEHLRQGHGSRLLRFAQSQRSELGLWSFEANTPARYFYESHGFHVSGDPSSDNEERAPALCYRWSSPPA